MIVQSSPLARSACSATYLIRRSSIGLSGAARPAEIKTNRVAPGVRGGMHQLGVALEVHGTRTERLRTGEALYGRYDYRHARRGAPHRFGIAHVADDDLGGCPGEVSGA